MDSTPVPMAEILEQIDWRLVDADEYKPIARKRLDVIYRLSWPKEGAAYLIEKHYAQKGHIPAIVFFDFVSGAGEYYFFIPTEPPRPLLPLSRHIKVYCAVPEIA